MMNNNTTNNSFVAYEYANIAARRSAESLYRDCYRSFGWEPADGRGEYLTNPEMVSLKMKRDRRINNRSEVTNLQHRCESALENIDHLERQKITSAISTAIALGVAGTVFMALATFCYLWGLIPLMVILAIPGFILWGVAYFAYNKVKKNKAAWNAPLIDAQYDIVYDTCEQAAALLAS